jgi:hypothetical protein
MILVCDKVQVAFLDGNPVNGSFKGYWNLFVEFTIRMTVLTGTIKSNVSHQGNARVKAEAVL